MSTLKKRLSKFYRKPVPSDITFEDVEVLARYFGCHVISGGNHRKIVHVPSGTVIPIPVHGKTVKEAYIKQLKMLFDMIKERSDEV